MVTVEKECLLPGRIIDPKTRQAHVITAADVRAAARNLNALVGKGRGVPLVWEHQDVEVGDPDEWKASYAKNTFGYAGRARLSTAADVKRGIASRPGTLLVAHRIFDRKDAEQLRRVRGVSPKLYRGYLDSDGTEYTGAVPVHIAATPTPVQWQQAPFKIELSDPTPVYLAYPRAKGRSCPPYHRPPKGLSLSSHREGAMADENDDDKDYGGDGEDGGKNAELNDLIEALREKGMNIPDDVSDWKHLIIAVKANGEASDPMPEEPAEPENPDDELDQAGAASGEDTTAPPGAGPMLMSTTDRNFVRRKRAQAEVKPDRDEAIARVDAALKAGKCTGFKARQLRRVFGACELSVTADGTVTGPRWDKAIAELAAIEQQPKGAAAGAIDLSSTVAAGAHPLGGAGKAAEKEADLLAVATNKMPFEQFAAKWNGK